MFIKNTLLFLLFSASVIFQLSFLEHGVLDRATPDIVLVMIAYFSNFYGSLAVLVPAFLAGFIRDILLTSPLGMYALLYTILAFLVGYTHQKLFVSSWFSAIALSLLAHTLQFIVLFSFSLIFRTESLFYNIDFLEILLEFFTGSALFIILFLINAFRKRKNGL